MDLKKRNFLEGKLPPPIGISDWETFSQTCYTVDKTLLIKALVDRKTHVALFTRPRRFGKTSALKMIRAFYEKSDTDTAYLFKDKQIWAAGERYQLLQGKNPVIYLTFKDHKAETWEQASQKMKLTVAGEVWRHREAVRASAADVMDARLLIRILDGEGGECRYRRSVAHFIRCPSPLSRSKAPHPHR